MAAFKIKPWMWMLLVGGLIMFANSAADNPQGIVDDLLKSQFPTATSTEVFFAYVIIGIIIFALLTAVVFGKKK